MTNQKFDDLKIVYVATTHLTPFPGNARHHSRKQIGKLADLISAQGYIDPIIVDEKFMILAGHGRLQAAIKAGLTKVPVIIAAGMSEVEKRSYVLSNNRIGDESEFSKKAVRAELAGILEIGGDLTATGFDSFEIDSLLAIDPDEPVDEDDVQLPVEVTMPVSRLGDCWHIGEHRIVCGDARDPESYVTLLKGEKAQQVVTDAPYGCPIANFVSGHGKVKHSDFVAGAGEESLSDFGRNLLQPAFKQIAANVQPGAIGYFFCDWRSMPYFHEAAEVAFVEQKNLGVWVKTNSGLGGFLRSQHELCQIWKLTPGKHINNMGLKRGRSNVWPAAGANVFRKGRMQDLADHATVKPRKLCEDIIIDTSRRGGLVLDPFAGSGTTLSAAHRVGRRGHGIELDPKFVDVILRRLSEVVEQSPLLNGEMAFEEVAAIRQADSAGEKS